MKLAELELEFLELGHSKAMRALYRGLGNKFHRSPPLHISLQTSHGSLSTNSVHTDVGSDKSRDKMQN